MTATPSPWAAPPPSKPVLAPSKHDGFAIASLVLGIRWVYGIGSILAVIFAAVSNSRAKKEGRSQSGMATAGLVLGIIGLGLLVLIIILAAVSAGGGYYYQ